MSAPLATRERVNGDARECGSIFWHGDLPPLDAEPMGEYTVEATSRRVPGVLAHRDELWNECYKSLMVQVRVRLRQEIQRLNGDYAHVLKESTDSRHDDATGEAWLHGCFTYMLYRRPGSQGAWGDAEVTDL